jgi:aspartate-semialdehyde dehydrogenase
VAVVGATTDQGQHVREALAERDVSGSRVDLYGWTDGEAVISEYAGEARLIQEPDLDEIVGHGIIFLCQTGDLSRQIASAARPEAVVLDLAGVLTGAAAAPSSIDPDAESVERRRLAVPHPLALVLGELLEPLDRGHGVEEVLAVVLRPAADFGEAGLEELREQTVRLLTFAEVPKKTFGRQLAFNILTQEQVGSDQSSLEARVANDVQQLLGWNGARLSLKLITAPVFHGHSLLLRLRLRGEPSAAQVAETLVDEDRLDASSDDRPSTPLEVSTLRRTCVAEVSEDGLGGLWLWAVAGEAPAKAAQHAVRVAARVGGL